MANLKMGDSGFAGGSKYALHRINEKGSTYRMQHRLAQVGVQCNDMPAKGHKVSLMTIAPVIKGQMIFEDAQKADTEQALHDMLTADYQIIRIADASTNEEGDSMARISFVKSFTYSYPVGEVLEGKEAVFEEIENDLKDWLNGLPRPNSGNTVSAMIEHYMKDVKKNINIALNSIKDKLEPEKLHWPDTAAPAPKADTSPVAAAAKKTTASKDSGKSKGKAPVLTFPGKK